MNSASYKSLIQPKVHFVYKWTHSNGDYYIGKHSGSYDDGYVGSGKLFRAKWTLSDGIDWARTILGEYPSSDAALLAEKEFVNDLWDIDDHCLNLVEGGGSGSGRSMEQSISTNEYNKSVRKKSSGMGTLYEGFNHAVVMKYIYLATNMTGHSFFIHRIPPHIQKTLNLLSSSKTKYPFGLMWTTLTISKLDQFTINEYWVDRNEKEYFDLMVAEIKTLFNYEEPT